MPELPDLVWVEKVLRSALVGATVTAARVGDPTVLRMMVPGHFVELLVGRHLESIERRGHFMRFGFAETPGHAQEDLVLVINAMLVGRYRLLEPDPDGASREKDPAGLAIALSFDGGRELRYLDEKRMGKVYVARPADEGSIPVYGALGVEVLSPSFDRAHFLKLAKRRRDQVRMFLMDKTALASIGNAYADEILFEAQLHPKTMVRRLSAEELDRLYDAIGTMLRRAIAEIERRAAPPDVKVRDFLSVRGRDGRPCPRCGTTIRSIRVGDGDACFCPKCQPATRALFVDWSRLPAGANTGGAADGSTNGHANHSTTQAKAAVQPDDGRRNGASTARGLRRTGNGEGRSRQRSPRSTSRRRPPSGS